MEGKGKTKEDEHCHILRSPATEDRWRRRQEVVASVAVRVGEAEDDKDLPWSSLTSSNNDDWEMEGGSEGGQESGRRQTPSQPENSTPG